MTSNYTHEQAIQITKGYANAFQADVRFVRVDMQAGRFSYWAWSYTTLHTIALGPGFFKLSKIGQIRCIIHEVLHCKYPPTLGPNGRQKGVHSGKWKYWVGMCGKGVHWIETRDILPEWRDHPYAKEPLSLNTPSNKALGSEAK